MRPLHLQTSLHRDTALEQVEVELVKLGILKSGERYIITSGTKMRESGSTDTLQIMRAK